MERAQLLTIRQRQIMQEIVGGTTDINDVADRLGINYKTVRSHLYNRIEYSGNSPGILERLGANNITHAVVKAIKYGEVRFQTIYQPELEIEGEIFKVGFRVIE